MGVAGELTESGILEQTCEHVEDDAAILPICLKRLWEVEDFCPHQMNLGYDVYWREGFTRYKTKNERRD